MYKASEAHEKYGAAEANELRIYYAFLYEKHRKIGYHQVNEGEEGAYHAKGMGLFTPLTLRRGRGRERCNYFCIIWMANPPNSPSR